MRISTRSMFETGTTQLGTLQSQIARTQMQLATNRRMLTPSDDPIASARALEITQSQSVNAQFAVNRGNARDSLTHVEMALGNAGTLLQDIKTLAISAGNGAFAQSDREALATELSGRLEDLMGIANSADASGNYMFSGFRTTTQPFTQEATGISYGGDHGQRELQVGNARKLEISKSGAAVFMDIPTGNGKFTAAPVGANVGSGLISQGNVSNPAAFNGDSYLIEFDTTTDPANPVYTITNTTTNTVVVAAQSYKSGEEISIGGMTFEIKGAPAHADQFTLKPAQGQSVFKTVEDLVKLLRTPATTATERESMTIELGKIGQNLSNALDGVLTARSSVGAAMKELDYLDDAGEELDIQYAARRSDLEDLDMVKAISQFTQQQFALEAAQKSFKTLSGLSLFNFIG